MDTRNSFKRRWFTAAAAILLACGAACVGHAATYTVTNLNDGGNGSLRQAVLSANGRSGADDIRFATNLAGTISLTSGELAITDDLTIAGPGADVLSVSRVADAAEFRVFLVGSGVTAEISGLTITGGREREAGGGILNDGALTVIGCTISDNRTTGWSTWEQEYGGGGGIFNTGDLLVADSTLSDNYGFYVAGGGIFNYFGTLTVINSTLSGNGAGYVGGGICHVGDTPAVILNSTIAFNGSTSGGGISTKGPIMNWGGGWSWSGFYQVEMRNTILAGNTVDTWMAGKGPDLYGILAVSGYNLIGDGTGGEGYAATDIVRSSNSKGSKNSHPIDPGLGPLADNGGPTLTHALLADSPAANAGDPAFDPYAFDPPLLTDQRGEGFDRVRGGRIDMGAFESAFESPPSGGKKPRK